MEDQETVRCKICGEQKKPSEIVPGELIQTSLVNLIRKEYPSWSSGDNICTSDLNHFKALYVEELLEKERGEVSYLEEKVINSMRNQELLSRNINIEFDEKLTFGERLADRFADFAGSWLFIILFFIVLIAWIGINSFILAFRPFDPYPFILLNLILSCLAAIQAPIIIMSQNRQEAKDRLQTQHDYQVDLKAELEIQNLHEKLDHLLLNQGQRLLEIQKIQVELMEELLSRKNS